MPPHNIEAEEALLGAALLSATALEVLATKVVPEDFYKPSHNHIATALIESFEQGHPADPVTIADALRRRNQIEAIGGTSTLVTLISNVPATSNAPRYAEIVHNDATLRRLMSASSLASELAQSRPYDVHQAVEKAQEFFSDVASQNGSRSYSSLDIPDMSALLSGELIQEQPSILLRSDGQALFYAGKMHVLQAEPSSGKSWIALFAALEVLNLGGSVIYLDYEDSSSGITSRLLALGADPGIIGERFQYVRPSGGMGITERVELLALLKKLNPDLLVIDGVAEAISRDGFDEDKNTDVVKWIDQYPRWIAQTGACVVMIDHIAKDKEKSGRYARGAGHKLSAVDGASYQIKIIHPFSRHKSGSVKLVVAKDRPGVFTTGEIAAMININPAADGTIVRMEVTKAVQMTTGDSWKPTKIMEKLSLEIERSPGPITGKLLVDIVSHNSKRGLVQDGLARLQVENYVTPFKIGGTNYMRLIKPYREGDQPLPPENLQPTLSEEWKDHEDQLAKRRAEKEKHAHAWHDPTDPGPSEPTD